MKSRPYIKITITRADGSRSEARIKGAHVSPAMIKAAERAIHTMSVTPASWPTHNRRSRP